MNLCVFTRTWLSSGAGLFAQELVAGLVGHGARVTFIAPPAEDARFEVPAPGLTRIRPPRERRDGSSKPVRALISLARVVGGGLSLLRARLTSRVFIVTIPDPLILSLPFLILLRLTGGRIIYVAHDPVPHAWRLPARFRAIEMGAHGLCYRLASAVVVLSEPSRAKLEEAFPANRTPVHVIEHGVFILGEPTPLPGDGLLLVFGTLRRNKGILEAIEGVIRARAAGVPVRLLIAGEPHNEDRSYWSECVAAAARAPEGIEIEIGYVPDDKLRDLLERIDGLILPYTSFFSQSGVALLAASNARPIVASAVGGIGALMAEGMPAAAIPLPVSSDHVATALAEFFRTPAGEWRHRADAYRAVTLERRSWAAIAGQYLALVKGLSA